MQVGMSCLQFSVLVLRRSKVYPSWLSFCWRLFLRYVRQRFIGHAPVQASHQFKHCKASNQYCSSDSDNAKTWIYVLFKLFSTIQTQLVCSTLMSISLPLPQSFNCSPCSSVMTCTEDRILVNGYQLMQGSTQVVHQHLQQLAQL